MIFLLLPGKMEWNLTNMFSPGLKPPTRKPVDVGWDVRFWLVSFNLCYVDVYAVKVFFKHNMWTPSEGCVASTSQLIDLKSFSYP